MAESSKKNYVIVLLSSVAAGIIVWAATHQGGPLNRPKAEVTIESVRTKGAMTDLFDKSVHYRDTVPLGRNYEIQLSVRNSGDASAQKCLVSWKDNTGARFNVASQEFDLPPKTTNPVTVDSPKYDQVGDASATIRVECANAASASYEYKFEVDRTRPLPPSGAKKQ